MQTEQGNVSLLEKSGIQALLLSLQKERNDLNGEITSLNGDLRLLLNLSEHETIEPALDEPALDKIDMEDIFFSGISFCLAERPDMKLAESRIRISEVNVRLQKSLAFPEIRIKGMYDRAGNFGNNYFAIGLNISIPVFNRNQGNIKAARLSVLQDKNLRQYMEHAVTNELVGVIRSWIMH